MNMKEMKEITLKYLYELFKDEEEWTWESEQKLRNLATEAFQKYGK